MTTMERYRAQGMDAGTAEILEIEEKHPEVAGWSKYLREAEFQQCDVCKELKFDELPKRTGYYLQGFGQQHHKSWDALKVAAEAGCHTCRLFHMVKLHEDQSSSSYKFTNDMTCVRVARDHSSINVNGEGSKGLRLGWSTLPDCPGDQLSDDPSNGTISFRFVEEDPASDEAFSRAKTWANHCLSSHNHCPKNENVPLPTRVLDIRDWATSGKVRLLETGNQLGRYIALSHCWGGSSGTERDIIRTCTTSNYAELQAGFAASRLPRNFQDAVLVGIKLGVRYIWIDSFCIIQDSSDDWNRESLRMSEVYGSSWLTVYASSAENSDAGFLNPRDQNRYLITKLCPTPNFPEHWIWIRWPSSDLVWSVSEATGKLWNRSWAFQELVLPARVLEYGKQMMNWRCNAQHIEEHSKSLRVQAHDGYKELMWILGLPDIDAPPSNEIPVHEEFAGHGSPITIYYRWYQMIEGYAGRELTKETDRLPAISGLANKVQRMTGDVYLAGLWKRDLAAGLCWGVRWNNDLTRPSTYIAPSWSWASTQGNVAHHFEHDRKFHIELVDFKLETEPLNPLGQVFSGSITVSGPIRQIDATKNTIYLNEEWDSDAEKLKPEIIYYDHVKKYGRVYAYALKDQNNVVDPIGMGICSLSLDAGSPAQAANVWLLRLVVSQAGKKLKKPDMSKLVPDGILLEKTEDGAGIFKRIGVFACVDAMAEWGLESETPALLGWETKAVTII